MAFRSLTALRPTLSSLTSTSFAATPLAPRVLPAFSSLSGIRAASTTSSYDSPDDNYTADRLPAGGSEEKRAFTYMVLGGARFLYASAARIAVIKGIATLSASADVLALASLEVDLSAISEGDCVTVKWRGKPVFIKHRTDDQITECQTPVTGLRDQEDDSERCQDPKWLIVLGVCTHLGCVPIPNAGDFNGWFCPCHGSHYDGSGRIRKGPAPLNLEVPPYKISDDTVLIG